MGDTIRLRPSEPDDDPFLFRLYASTWEGVLARIGWSEAETLDFLRLQHRARMIAFRERYPEADDRIILSLEEPAGRLLVNRASEELRIVDVALLPAHRGRGIGSHLLRLITTEAEAAGKPVRLHVERSNPALRLYDRLGFAIIGEAGISFEMEYVRPNAADALRTSLRVAFDESKGAGRAGP